VWRTTVTHPNYLNLIGVDPELPLRKIHKPVKTHLMNQVLVETL